MDLRNAYKIIKDDGRFLFEIFILTKSDKKEMRAKNKKQCHFEQHYEYAAIF
jgi:hypothetical protein